MINVMRLRRLLAMLLVFALCFATAVYLFVIVLREESPNSGESSAEVSAKRKQDLFFPDAININKAQRFLKVESRAELLPSAKTDYFLLFWVNLRSLPAVGERLVLLSKYNGTPPKISGYAVAISRDSNAVRPVLFWGDGSTAGSRWYDFPEIAMSANQWTLFGLHLHKDKFVGMYTASVSNNNEPVVKFLGGHEIDLADALKIGTADIVFGAPSGRDFKGKIGPLAIINPLSIGGDRIASALGEYIKSPLDFSMLGSDSEIQILIKDGRKDISRNQHQVTVNY